MNKKRGKTQDSKHPPHGPVWRGTNSPPCAALPSQATREGRRHWPQSRVFPPLVLLVFSLLAHRPPPPLFSFTEGKWLGDSNVRAVNLNTNSKTRTTATQYLLGRGTPSEAPTGWWETVAGVKCYLGTRGKVRKVGVMGRNT